MILLDTNYILRYLLRDNEKMFRASQKVIGNQHCLVLESVLAEVVYVLSGVYNVPKLLISKTLSQFISLDNISLNENISVFITALEFYQSKNLDFVDCCLCARKDKFEIKSFDKKLTKCIQENGKT
jgi:predicted nucleic-acid-binding protein